MPGRNIFSSIIQNAKIGMDFAEEVKQKRELNEIKQETANIYSDPKFKDDPEAALKEMSTRFGKSGNVNGISYVMKMADSLEKQKGMFTKQMAPAAMWILASPKEERSDRMKWFAEKGKKIGALPKEFDVNSITEEQLANIAGFEGVKAVFDKEYKAAKVESEGSLLAEKKVKLGAETEATKALEEERKAKAGYYERKKDSAARGRDKSLTDKDIAKSVAAKKMLRDLESDPKRKKMMQDLGELKSVELEADLIPDDHPEAIRRLGPKKKGSFTILKRENIGVTEK